MKVDEWWLQIGERNCACGHAPPGAEAEDPVYDWTILYKDTIACSGISALSLTKTRVLLKTIFESIKDTPPKERPEYGVIPMGPHG